MGYNPSERFRGGIGLKDDDELGFLMESTDIKKSHLYPWRFIPEFRQKVLDKKQKGESIDNKCLLQIMQEVMGMMEGEAGSSETDIRKCMVAIRGLSDAINGDKTQDQRNPFISLHFLFKKLPTSEANVKAWMLVPQFRDEMLRLKYSRILITKEMVLQTMRVIYDDAENNPDQYPGFRFFACGQAILDLELALGLQTEDLKYDTNAKVFGSDFKPKCRE